MVKLFLVFLNQYGKQGSGLRSGCQCQGISPFIVYPCTDAWKGGGSLDGGGMRRMVVVPYFFFEGMS